MPKKPQQLEKEVLKAGFVLEKGKGKGGHRRYKHPDGRTTEISFHSVQSEQSRNRQGLNKSCLAYQNTQWKNV